MNLNLKVPDNATSSTSKTFFCRAGDILPLVPSASKNAVSLCKAICASSDPFDNDCENIT